MNSISKIDRIRNREASGIGKFRKLQQKLRISFESFSANCNFKYSRRNMIAYTIVNKLTNSKYTYVSSSSPKFHNKR